MATIKYIAIAITTEKGPQKISFFTTQISWTNLEKINQFLRKKVAQLNLRYLERLYSFDLVNLLIHKAKYLVLPSTAQIDPFFNKINRP